MRLKYDAQVERCALDEARGRREQACARAAASVEARQAPQTQGTDLLPGELELLSTMASRTLEAVDMRKFATVPCKETASAQRIQAAFVLAAKQVVYGWLAKDIPRDLKAAVKNGGLAAAAAGSLRERVEEDAVAALKGTPVVATLNEVVVQCDAAGEMLGDDGPKCKLARIRVAAMVAREDAIEKARKARCAAQSQAQEQCTKRCEDRLPKDEMGFPDFDRGMDCGARYEAAIPMTDC